MLPEKSGKVNVHFTVSTEHRELFKKLVDEKVDEFSKRYGVDYYITFSEQKAEYRHDCRRHGQPTFP